MKAVVTGAAGFVGSRLVGRLLQDGHRVIGVDSFTDYYSAELKRRNIAPYERADFHLVEGDLNQLGLEDLLSDADLVFHQAGQPGVRKSWGQDFSVYLEQNVQSTQRLLEAARNVSRLRRFVYASSSSVYGDAENYPTRETDRPRPVSPYGVTKLAAEHLCVLYARNFGVPTTSLRYFTVYGPGQRPDMAFTRFVKAVVTGEEVRIFGDGSQVRDFTYIDDVVEANILASMDDDAPGIVLNVSGGSNISVNDALAIIGRLAGGKLNVCYTSSVPGDVRRTGGDTGAILTRLGWRAKVDIEQGLANHYAWAKSIYGSTES